MKKERGSFGSRASAVWAKMTSAEQRAANQKFLDRAIAKGSRILLKTSVQDAQPGSAYEWELRYLYAHGYRPTKDGLEMVWS